MEELLATKERVVNILEEIIEKEYTTPQDMAEMIQDNWDITEEYERQIADITKGIVFWSGIEGSNGVYRVSEREGHVETEI